MMMITKVSLIGSVLLLLQASSLRAYKVAQDQPVHHDGLESRIQREVQSQTKKLINEIQNQKQTLSSLEKSAQIQEQNLNQLSQELNLMKNVKALPEVKNPTTYTKHAFGCLADQIQLSCSDNRTILVSHADYSEYFRDCTSECCSPHPYDCVESMAENNPVEWDSLKDDCDGQTSCTHLFQGSTFINDCTASAAVDYLSIYYSCIPVDTSEKVAFTATATAIRTYSADDIVLFDSAITNLGGYYLETASIFICPFDGVYVFGLNFLSTIDPEHMGITLMQDARNLTAGAATDNQGIRHTGSTLVVTGCSAGQKIWARSKYSDAKLNGDGGRFSTFTGFLLN